MGNTGCLTCAAWDHAEHKFPGGKPVREPRCAVIVEGRACGGAHRRWFHDNSVGGGAHSVVVAAPKQGPGLYKVYLAPVHSPDEEDESKVAAGMIMVDPGSDTNFIRHEFAAQLGLQGEPCQLRLKEKRGLW